MELAPAGAGDRVIDVGCGTGNLLAGYAELGATCTGVDLSPAMLDVARSRLPEADLRVVDATDLPFADASQDLVLASLFLHELDPDTRSAALAEMTRVADPDGRVVVVDYHAGSLRWQGRGWRAFSTVTERLAGRTHYGAWRTYLAEGGLPTMVPSTLAIEQTKLVAGGNLAIWVMRGTQSG